MAVTNGDTLYKANLHNAAIYHMHHMAECTLLLKPMTDFDRYGVVETDKEKLVTSFKEKQYYKEGNINGGLYLLDAGRFMDEEFPQKFSLKKIISKNCITNDAYMA